MSFESFKSKSKENSESNRWSDWKKRAAASLGAAAMTFSTGFTDVNAAELNRVNPTGEVPPTEQLERLRVGNEGLITGQVETSESLSGGEGTDNLNERVAMMERDFSEVFSMYKERIREILDSVEYFDLAPEKANTPEGLAWSRLKAIAEEMIHELSQRNIVLLRVTTNHSFTDLSEYGRNYYFQPPSNKFDTVEELFSRFFQTATQTRGGVVVRKPRVRMIPGDELSNRHGRIHHSDPWVFTLPHLRLR